MSKKSFGSLFWVAPLVACGACSTVAEEPTPIREQGLELSAATRSLPLKISLPQRSVDDATTTVREVLGVIVGVDVAAGNFDLVPSREGGRIAGRVRSAPRIVGSYEPAKDEVDVTDLDVASDMYSADDIGEPQASLLAKGVLGSLIQRGVASEALHDFDDAHRELLKQGSGQFGEEPVVRVKEYRYFIPTKVAGITVNDGGQADFGVRVSVHRSGKIAGIRVSGLGAVISEVAGTSTVHKVSNASLNARALSEFPNAEVTPLGLRYSIAPGHESDPVVAMAAFRVTPERVVDGRFIRSRSMMVYYSVDDSLAEPRVWPEIIGHETGAPR